MTNNKRFLWLPTVFWWLCGLFLVSLVIIRWQYLPLATGLLLLASAALLLLIYSLVLLVSMVMVAAKGGNPRSGQLLRAILGLLPVSLFLATVGAEGLQAPAIHDISTDTHNPPAFAFVLPARNESHNSLVYEGEPIAIQQRQAFPDLSSYATSEAPERVFAAVKYIVAAKGWQLAGAELGVIEAVVSSAVLGFKDDVIIRIVSDGTGGSIVDMRSVSRVGTGDLGANAKRIKTFFNSLDEKILK